MRISEVKQSDGTQGKASFKARPMPKNVAVGMKNALLDKSVKTIDLYCHNSPDEDTVNSMKVLYNWLKKMGKKVSACLNTEDAKGLYFNRLFYHLRPKDDRYIPDRAVCLDFNGTERLPSGYAFYFDQNPKENILAFDHHTKANTYIHGKRMYIDDTASSCCGVIARFFEALGENISKKDAKSLYCGMLSDYRGSKLISIKKGEDNKYQLIKKPELYKDKNALEILEKVEKLVSDKDKNKIYKHLDILSKLTQKEKEYMKQLVSYITLSTQNGLAYIFIPPDDQTWTSLRMDNRKTSAMLKDIRTRVMGDIENDDMFTPQQKEKLKNVKAIAIFYRSNPSENSSYQMSIHSKGGYSKKLIDYVRENFDNNLIAGGHQDRAGGKLNSINFNDTIKFVNNFLEADKQLSTLHKQKHSV